MSMNEEDNGYSDTDSDTSENEISEEMNEKGYKDQYRCTLNGINELFGEIRKELTDQHRDVMDRTPFKHFFRALDNDEILVKKTNNDILDKIIETYDKESKGFKFGSKVYRPTKLDIKLIFGIQDGMKDVGKMTRRAKSESRFASRLFPATERLTAKMVKEFAKRMVFNEDRKSIKDTIRLLCLLLFESLFFTTTGQTIPWRVVCFVDDFYGMNKYDWSQEIHNKLMKGLNSKWSNPRKVTGCTVSLLYWFCEHSNEIEDRLGDTNDGHRLPEGKGKHIISCKGIPRITKWDLKEVKRLLTMKSLANLEEDKFNANELHPTLNEEDLVPSVKKQETVDPFMPACDSDFEEDVIGDNGKERSIRRSAEAIGKSKQVNIDNEKEIEKSIGQAALVQHIPMRERMMYGDNERDNEEPGKERALEQQPSNEIESELPSQPSFSLLSPTQREVSDNTNEKVEEAIIVTNIDTMENQIVDQEEEIERLVSQVEKVKLENMLLNKKQYELEAGRNDLRLKLNEEVAKRIALTLKLENFNYSKIRADDEIALANITIQNLHEMMQYQEAKIKVLENEVEENRKTASRIQMYTKHLVESNEKLRGTSEKIGAMEHEDSNLKMIETLKATVAELETKLSERETRISSVYAQIEAQRESIQKFQAKVRNTNNTINEQGRKIEELEKELDEFREAAINDAVHEVTQSAGRSIPKVEGKIGVSSMFWRVKNKGRLKKANRLEDFEYDDLRIKRRKEQIVDVESYNIPDEDGLLVDRALVKENKKAYKCGRFICEDAFTRIRDANKYGGRVEEVWSAFPGSIPYVTVASVMAILDEKYIHETIIDAFIVILGRSGLIKEKHHIFPATTWDRITSFEEKHNYDNVLSRDIVKKIQDGQKIFFPLCCPGKQEAPYHWVLLTYGGDSGIWKMYHSYPIRSLNLDPFINNCERIRKYVWRCLYPNEATTSKRNTRGADGVAKIKKLPLQHNESADCAFYLIYYMLKLSQGQTIPPSWTDDELQKLKGSLVNSIVLDMMAIEF